MWIAPPDESKRRSMRTSAGWGSCHLHLPCKPSGSYAIDNTSRNRIPPMKPDEPEVRLVSHQSSESSIKTFIPLLSLTEPDFNHHRDQKLTRSRTRRKVPIFHHSSH